MVFFGSAAYHDLTDLYDPVRLQLYDVRGKSIRSCADQELYWRTLNRMGTIGFGGNDRRLLRTIEKTADQVALGGRKGGCP
ncbi:hypothetical protein C2L64_48445 [Paraburkholderia hospita]|jgi:hypothetical protein|uniref:Uncharacterized protein n=1 Tax=Paraburkholderia hospita TaxID=169430 RepID=A0AAN1JN45_9BURK|nr:hypothetical protein C2L64_48445 [Paraburkholderia hospita]